MFANTHPVFLSLAMLVLPFVAFGVVWWAGHAAWQRVSHTEDDERNPPNANRPTRVIPGGRTDRF